MPAVTINNVNKALSDNNLPFEIVKGDCYFWFAPFDHAPMDLNVDSIYSNHIRGMTIAEYVAHVECACNEWAS